MNGLARRIREMKEDRKRANWPQLLSRHIAELYLWVQGYSRIDDLSDSLRDELLLQGGWTLRKEEILQFPGKEDNWFVLSSSQNTEGQLKVQKTWFWGLQHGIPALLLDYLWGSEAFPQSWSPGSAFHGSLHFYPGAFPLRAIAGDLAAIAPAFSPGAGVCDTLNEMALHFTAIAAQNPWVADYPFLLRNIRIFPGADKQWLLMDSESRIASVETGEDLMPAVLHTVGESPVPLMFGLWNGKSFRLIHNP